MTTRFDIQTEDPFFDIDLPGYVDINKEDTHSITLILSNGV